MKPKVLIVDDEHGLSSTLEVRLKRQGLEVEVSSSAQQALKKFQSGRQYDVVLCDLKMPGMTGIELIKQVKPDRSDTSFLIMTGYPDKDSIQESSRIGVFDYLLKPFDHQALLQKLEEIQLKKKEKAENPAA